MKRLLLASLLLLCGCATVSNTENRYGVDKQTFATQLSTTNSRTFFAASAAADLTTTGIGISQGFHEANPIFGRRSSRSLLFAGLFSLAQYGITEWIRNRSGDEAANRWLKIYGGIHFGAAGWNSYQISKGHK